MPESDSAFSALLEDLDERGLLDSTLVVWVGEFGRKPTINRQAAGREHWPRCFSGVFAGAGVRGGSVHGSSDRIAAFPQSDPHNPSDVAATIFHALGIAADREVLDPLQVPRKVYSGTPILPIFS